MRVLYSGTIISRIRLLAAHPAAARHFDLNISSAWRCVAAAVAGLEMILAAIWLVLCCCLVLFGAVRCCAAAGYSRLKYLKVLVVILPGLVRYCG